MVRRLSIVVAVLFIYLLTIRFDTLGVTQQMTANLSSPAKRVIAMSANFHNLLLLDDGTVWGWGHNTWAQLGDGTNATGASPIRLSGLNKITRVAAAAFNSLALQEGGTVWAIGRHSSSILDPPAHENTFFTPTPVRIIPNVVDLAANHFHYAVLKGDGTVWMWETQDVGRVGDASPDPRFPAIQVPELTDIRRIAVGWNHGVALRRDGLAWSWKVHDSRQGGQRCTSARVEGLADLVAIAAGAHYAVALRRDGTLWAWGRNFDGQLGDGTREDRQSPVQVQGLKNVVAVSAGIAHTVAVLADGSVWTWGRNDSGQLGSGIVTKAPWDRPQSLPRRVRGLPPIVLVAAGGAHVIAAGRDGSVWAWGENHTGQLGIGSISTSGCYCNPTPVHVMNF